MDTEIHQALCALARGARVLAALGHEDLTLGHVSMRDPGGRGVWMKRRGLSLGELKDESGFLLVDWNGEVLEGDGRRHSEWPLHTEVLRARPELLYGAHTHPEWATLLTAVDNDLPPVSQDAMRAVALGMARFDDTADLVQTRDEGRAVARCLGTTDRIALLRNHGVSFFGESLPMLVLAGVWLERGAKAYLRLCASGLPLHPSTVGSVPDVTASVTAESFLDDNWAYLERKTGA